MFKKRKFIPVSVELIMLQESNVLLASMTTNYSYDEEDWLLLD